VAGAHAAAAVDDRLRRCVDVSEAVAKIGDGQMQPVGSEIVGVWEIDRSRNVTGTWVERLDFAAKAFSRPGVDHRSTGLDCGGDVISGDDSRPSRWNRVAARLAVDHRCVDRMSGSLPCGEAAIEYGDMFMTDGPEHPPQPRRECAAHVVVGDNECVRRDAQVAEEFTESSRGWERMTTAPTRRASVMDGEIGVQVDKAPGR